MSDGLKVLLGVLAGAIVVLLSVSVLGGGGMMFGMLFALLFWAALVVLLVALVFWIVNRTRQRR